MRASKEAAAALRFLSRLTVPEGRLAGKRLKLGKYQKDFVHGAFAKDTSIGVLSVGRGAAKTAIAAGIALGHLVGEIAPQPKREIILAARNRDQAKIAFNFLLGFIEGLPDEERAQFKIRHGSKLEIETAKDGGGLARVIAADGRSILGGAPTLAILDERAAWDGAKGDALENAILSGLGKRDGRCLIISTSAPDDANTFSRWLDDPPPQTYVQEHRPAPNLPPDDLESLLIANPGAAAGVGSSPEWLVSEARRAISRGGSALSSFRNLNRNERVAADNRSVLITIDEWLSCEVGPDDLPPRSGGAVLGIDLGGSRSMSAAALYWPDTGRLECVGAFATSPALLERGQADGVKDRYVQMADRGELLTIGDTVVDAGGFAAAVVKQLDSKTPCAVVCDRFRQAEFLEALAAAGLDRVPIVWRGMGWKDGGEDCERFRRAVFEGEVKTTPSLLLRSAFAEAITLVDPANNHKIAKGRSNGRIDSACAALLAVAEGVRISNRAVPKKPRLVWG